MIGPMPPPPPKRPTQPAARVPQSRAGRLATLAATVGGLALGGLAESVRRLSSGRRQADAPSALLSTANAQRLAQSLSTLRGAAMKLGQMLSMHGDDLLPPAFAQALAVLRAQAAPMPPAQLRRVLGREYGKGWEAKFSYFDADPLAAASIGQVHRARAADGRELALKIQYPGVARSIRSDVDNLATLLRVLELLPAHIDAKALAAEAARQLSQEADYRAEAEAFARYAALVADEPMLCVPRIHADLSTARILAMDFMPGEPLETLSAPEVPQSTRDAIGSRLEHLMFRELFEFGLMQSDPNFANYLWQPDSGRLVLLDFGSWLAFEPDFVQRYRQMTRAVLADDRDAIARGAQAIGYIAEDDPAAMVDATVDMIQLVCEPLRHRGVYDFAASDLPARVRATGFELGFRQARLRSPPPQTVFLHRKLVGSFLALAHIGARVDARGLVRRFL